MEEEIPESVEPYEEDVPSEGIWSLLSDEQKKYFKKLTEKNKENLRYIG